MQPDPSANPLIQFVPFLLIILIFYFIFLKPERKKQQERKEQLASIKKNDHIVTAGGVHGIIVNLKETTVIVRIDDNVKIEVDKEAITSIQPKE